MRSVQACHDMLKALKGVFDFAPSAEPNPDFPSQYVSGHVVKATDDGAKFTIPFGTESNARLRVRAERGGWPRQTHHRHCRESRELLKTTALQYNDAGPVRA